MSSNENFGDSSNSSFDPLDFTAFDEWQEHLIIQNRQIDSMIDDVAFRIPSIVKQSTKKHVGDSDAEEDCASSKKSRSNEGDDDSNNLYVETHVSEASTVHRPTAKGKTKGKRNVKTNASQQSVIPDDYTGTFNALRLTQEIEVETMNKIIDIELETMNKIMDIKFQSTMMVSKMNMLNTLFGKSNLSPQEQSLKTRLIQELFP